MSDPNKASPQQLVQEAKEIYPLLDKDEPFQDDSKLVWLLSSSWLSKWKQKTGFAQLKAGEELNESHTQPERALGVLNQDLVVEEEPQKEVLKVKNLIPELAYLDLFLKKGLFEDDDFIFVGQNVWNCFKKLYPNAIEVARPLYKNNKGEISAEIHLHLV